MQFPLPERPRAVVTGAASGFGRAISLRLAERGARLVLSDIDEDGLAETKKLATAASEVRTRRCDVRDAAQVEALALDADQAYGGTDLVVNNAGVAVAGRVGEVSLEDWHWQIDINLWGVIHGCHAFVPRMKAQGSGWVLNVASSAGLVSMPQLAPYNVTKAAVVALSETMRGELIGTGVGVTALCPTFFRTRIHEKARSPDQEIVDRATKWVTRSKWSAEQIADAAIAGIERGELYVIPQADGRFAWRAKRLLGDRFYGALGRMARSSRFARWMDRG